MSQLDDLYKEVILDHYRRPRSRGALEAPPAVHARGYNPLCGDEVDVYAAVDANGLIEEVAFEGKGCAISQASASMMTERVRGLSVAEFRRSFGVFKAMLGVDGDEGEADEGDGDAGDGDATGRFSEGEELGKQLGDAEALQGVRQFPSRIKCATLAWNTLEQAIAGRGTFEET